VYDVDVQADMSFAMNLGHAFDTYLTSISKVYNSKDNFCGYLI